MVSGSKKQVDNSIKRFNKNQNENVNLLESGEFSVGNNLKAEYDMWSWIYQEIANLRIRVTHLGMMVRLNNPNSPSFLEAYHSDIYSLLVPISVVIPDATWTKIEKMWLDIKLEINEYLKQRSVIHNKKIPFDLIRKLDKLYRISLLIAQKAGLGFKITTETDLQNSIEKAIVGE